MMGHLRSISELDVAKMHAKFKPNKIIMLLNGLRAAPT